MSRVQPASRAPVRFALERLTDDRLVLAHEGAPLVELGDDGSTLRLAAARARFDPVDLLRWFAPLAL